MGVFGFLTVVTIVAARSVESTDSTVAIFNGWKPQNKPVKFSWAPDQNEKSSEIDNFANDAYFQFRWTCSAYYNKQMLVIGGMPIGADTPTNAFEVKDCSITETDIILPFAMGGHSCAVNKDKLYICSSEFDVMDKNCTVYDGKSFMEIATTDQRHVLGSMASMNGSLIIMGGELYQGKDTDAVEVKIILFSRYLFH